MELIFIGVGGTRKVTARQPRNVYTGGFRIHTEKLKFHVDPGPSALIRSKHIGINIEDTDVVILSHPHIDHYSDFFTIAVAMNGFGFKKRGLLFCHKSFRGQDNNERIIQDYFISMFKKAFFLEENEEVNIEHKDDFSIKTTKTDHDKDLKGFGFILTIENKKIGYTSDTRYFPGLFKQFEDCDVLIANITNIKKYKYNPHLSINDIENLYKECKPKKLFIYHIGEEIIAYGIKKLERFLRNKYLEDIIIPISGSKFEI